MYVVVLGGAGAMGRVCVMDLAASEVDEIVVADLNEAAASACAAASAPLRNTGLIRGIGVDARDPTSMEGLLERADVVVNCINYTMNTDIMRLAARSGTTYVDLGGLYHETRRQLEHADEVEAAGVLCIVGMGSTPGTMNVMAELGAQHLDEVHEIDLRCGGYDPRPSMALLPAPYAIDTILDEFTLPAIALRDGEMVELPPASHEEAFDFPDPIGLQSPVATVHSELATMPSTFADRGVRSITFKVSFPPNMTARYRFLNALGFTTKEPVDVDGVSIVPRELVKRAALAEPQEFSGLDIESLVVVLTGTRDGKAFEVRVDEVSHPNETLGVGGADANTGIPPSIVAQMIGRGDIKGTGVKAPEEVVPPEPYVSELAKRNITIEVSERSLEGHK